VAADADGDFVVAWASNAQDGSSLGIFAQRFSSAGTPLAGEFQVNAHTAGIQFLPSVAAGADGDFVVGWSSYGQDAAPYLGVLARHFSSAGVPLSGDLQVNSYTGGGQVFASVAADAAGDFVVTWSSNGQDGSGRGVFAQRFGAPAVLDIDADGSVGALTDGLLILRYLFGLTGATLVDGAVDSAGCHRCDASAIEVYLATLL
jgi:hypothetical protein